MNCTRATGVIVLFSILVFSSGALSQPSADWTYLYDATHTGVTADPVDMPLALSWRYATEGTGQAVSTPAIGPDRIYFAYGSKLYAVDRATGAVSWPLGPTELNTQVTSGLVLDGGTLYFGAADGKLWAVDAAGGTAKWKYAAEGPIKSAPLVHDGIVYFGSNDGGLYAFDLSTDRSLEPFEASGPIQSTPAIWKDYVFVSSQDGYVYALRRTSSGFRMVWHAQVTAAYMELFSSPVVHRGQVLVGASNRLIALDAQRGTRRWTFVAGGLIAGSPAVRGRRAYIGTAEGVVYCLNTTQGKALWRFPKQGSCGPIRSSPVLAGDVLLVRGGGTKALQFGTTPEAQTLATPTCIYGLSPNSGELLWEYRLPKPQYPVRESFGGVLPAGSPGYTPGMEVDIMERGTLKATPEMRQLADPYIGFVDGCVVTIGGSLYVLDDDGTLYSFDAGAVDNEKPTFKQTIITFPGPQAGTAYSFAIPNESEGLFFPLPEAEDLIQIPGAPPLRVTTEAMDAGSGLDPDSVQILMDGQPVPALQRFYDSVQGMIWWIYDPQLPQARNYPAGLHTLTVRATDWSGNQGGANIYFVIDNSLTQPKIPGMPQQPYGYDPGGFGTGYPGMPGGPGGPGGPYAPQQPYF